MKNSLQAGLPSSVRIFNVKMNIRHTPTKVTCRAFQIEFHNEDQTLSKQFLDVIWSENAKYDFFTIKNNIELLVENMLFSVERLDNFDSDYLAKNIPVKVVTIENNILAIGNTQGTKFLLVDNLKKSAIDKATLFILISSLLNEKTYDTLKKFSNDVQVFGNFLNEHKKFFTYLTSEEIDRLIDLVDKFDSLLKKE